MISLLGKSPDGRTVLVRYYLREELDALLNGRAYRSRDNYLREGSDHIIMVYDGSVADVVGRLRKEGWLDYVAPVYRCPQSHDDDLVLLMGPDPSLVDDVAA